MVEPYFRTGRLRTLTPPYSLHFLSSLREKRSAEQ